MWQTLAANLNNTEASDAENSLIDYFSMISAITDDAESAYSDDANSASPDAAKNQSINMQRFRIASDAEDHECEDEHFGERRISYSSSSSSRVTFDETKQNSPFAPVASSACAVTDSLSTAGTANAHPAPPQPTTFGDFYQVPTKKCYTCDAMLNDKYAPGHYYCWHCDWWLLADKAPQPTNPAASSQQRCTSTTNQIPPGMQCARLDNVQCPKPPSAWENNGQYCTEWQHDQYNTCERQYMDCEWLTKATPHASLPGRCLPDVRLSTTAPSAPSLEGIPPCP